MKLINAIKKLEKYTEVKKDGIFYQAVKGSEVIEFIDNGGMGEITCIKVRRINDHDDSMTDYSAGVFCDNLTQALKISGFMEAVA